MVIETRALNVAHILKQLGRNFETEAAWLEKQTKSMRMKAKIKTSWQLQGKELSSNEV